MKRYLLLVGCVFLLAGCGSSVKLDDVPVEDKTATPVTQQAAAGQGAAGATGSAGAVSSSTIVPLSVAKPGAGAAPPAGSRMVYFDYDSFVIKPEFQQVIEVQARYIKVDKNLKVAIEGHTDDRGGREYNLALGQKRSEAVRRALVLLGVADIQLEAVSFGKEKPAVQGADEASMAKNRRAEIVYR